MEFTDAGLQGAAFILCTQKLGPQHTSCIELFNQAVLTAGPTLFPQEHGRINDCMLKQSGKKFERAMKVCKKPYEKLWTAYGTWFQQYFGSMTGETCKPEFDGLNECIGAGTDDPKEMASLIERCKSKESALMHCRASTMFGPQFKEADKCVGKKTPECDRVLRTAARSMKLAGVYHTAFWSFVTENAQDFLNSDLSPEPEN